MEVSFSDSFKKVFKKRVKSTEIETEFWIRLELFVNDPLCWYWNSRRSILVALHLINRTSFSMECQEWSLTLHYIQTPGHILCTYPVIHVPYEASVQTGWVAPGIATFLYSLPLSCNGSIHNSSKKHLSFLIFVNKYVNFVPWPEK